jgi:hypothetical protein
MDARPEKFDLEFWKDIAKLLSRLAVVAVVALGGVSGTEQYLAKDLNAEEAKAGQTSLKADAYPDFYDLVKYHAERDARCDQALEMFARHRDDDHDWEHVLSACHSETPEHEHEEGP